MLNAETRQLAARRTRWLCVLTLALLPGCSAPEPPERMPLRRMSPQAWQPAPESLIETRWLSAEEAWRDGVFDVLASEHPVDFLWLGWSGIDELASTGSVSSRGEASSVRFLLYPAQAVTLCLDAELIGAVAGETEIPLGMNGVVLEPIRLGAERRRVCVSIAEDAMRWGDNWLEFHFRGAPLDPLADDYSEARARRPDGARVHGLVLEASAAITGPEFSGVRFGDTEPAPALVQTGSGRQHVVTLLPEIAELRLEIARAADTDASAEASGPVEGSIYIASDQGNHLLWFGALMPGERSGPIRLDLGAFRSRAVRLQFAVGEGAAGRDWFWIDPRLVRRPVSPPGRIDEQLIALEGEEPAPKWDRLTAPNRHLVVVTVDEMPPFGSGSSAEDSQPAEAGARGAEAFEAILPDSLVFERTHTTSLDPALALRDVLAGEAAGAELASRLAAAGWSLAKQSRGEAAIEPLAQALASASRPVYALLSLASARGGEIRRLVEALRAHAVLEASVVAVVGLRGPDAPDAGSPRAGLREERLATGMAIRLPHGAGAGRIDVPASLADFTPTLLGILGVAAESRAVGRDLQRLLADPGAAPRVTSTRATQSGAQVLWLREFRYEVDPLMDYAHLLTADWRSRRSQAPEHPVTLALLEQARLERRRSAPAPAADAGP